MMRNATSRGVLAALAGLAATQAHAFIAPASSPKGLLNGIKVESKVIRPEVYPSAELSADDTLTFLDSVSNSVRQMSGSQVFGIKVNTFTKAAFETAALAMIQQHHDVFGIDVSDARINHRGTLVDALDQIVQVEIYREGIKIHDAGITFRFKKGLLISLSSETYAEAAMEPSTVTDTAAIVSEAFHNPKVQSQGQIWRAVATHSGYSLVKVDQYLVAGADAPWITQVNTNNGELFEVRPRNLSLRGVTLAPVYPRFFGDKIENVFIPFATVQNATTAADNRGEFNTADDVTAPKMDGFAGQFVIVKNDAGANIQGVATKAGNQWQLKFAISPAKDLWDNGDMAQSMAYANLNRVIARAKNYIQNDWLNKPLTANVNLSEHCNAYWDGSTVNFFSAGGNFGEDCANTALISDVAYHEWGHGLHANTSGISDSSLSEGFGDAVALLFTNDSILGKEFFVKNHKPVRDMSILKKYPEDMTGEPHAEGQIFAGAMYDMYTGLKAKLGIEKANDLYAKFIFKGIYTYKKMNESYDAIIALDAPEGGAAKAPNLCVINAAFAKHGLAKADETCPK